MAPPSRSIFITRAFNNVIVHFKHFEAVGRDAALKVRTPIEFLLKGLDESMIFPIQARHVRRNIFHMFSCNFQILKFGSVLFLYSILYRGILNLAPSQNFHEATCIIFHFSSQFKQATQYQSYLSTHLLAKIKPKTVQNGVPRSPRICFLLLCSRRSNRRYRSILNPPLHPWRRRQRVWPD